MSNAASQGEFQEDRWGNLWISNSDCLLRYNPREDNFKRFFFNLPNADTIRSKYYFTYLDGQNDLLYATANDHLFCSELDKYGISASSYLGWFDRSINDKIHIDENGDVNYLSIKGRSDTLHWMIHDKCGQVKSYKNYPTLNRDTINTFAVDKHEKCWIGTRNGIFMLDTETGSFINPFDNTTQTVKEVSLLKNIGQDTLLVYSEFGNIYFFHTMQYEYVLNLSKKNDRIFEHVHLELDRMNIDQQGNYWLSTTSDGLSYGNFLKTKFQELATSKDSTLELVNDIHESEVGKLWLLLRNSVQVSNGENIKTIELPTNGRGPEQTVFIYTTTNEDCFVGTLNKLFYKSSKENVFRKVIVTDESNRSISNQGFQAILKIPSGGYLLSANQGPIYWAKDLDISSDTFSVQKVENSNQVCRTVEINPESILASYSTNDTLSVSFYKKGKIFIDTFFINMPYISTIKWDESRNQFWLSTHDGLFHLKENTEQKWSLSKIKLIDQSPLLQSLVLDPTGDLWMTASGKIIHYKPDENETYTYTLADGLQGTDFVLNSSLLASDGQIYFGGTRGVNVFRPAEVYPKMPPARPGITGIIIDGDPKLFWQYNSGGSRNTLDSQRLVLPPSVGPIELHLSAREYSAPKDCRFRYLLEGSRNAEWVELGNEPTISLPNLAFGHYKLLVMASNSEGIWSDRVHTLYLRIRPPVYARWWFVGLIFLFGLTQVVLFFRRREKRRAEASDIQLAMERLTLSPHVLFNGLTNTSSLIKQRKNQEAVAYLSRFSGLMRNIMNNSKLKTVGLDDEIALLETYLEIEQQRLGSDHAFQYQIIYEGEFDPFEFQVPVLLFQPFVENAVLHGVKPIKSDGRIALRFREDKGFLLVDIQDNGQGRQASGQKSADEQKNHNGIATPTIERRFRRMNRMAGRKVAQFTIVDLGQKDGSSTGTLVHFRLDGDYFNQLANREAARRARQAANQKPGRTT
ncbi:MAG: histidine kinase [Bacteroidota bacterium]